MHHNLAALHPLVGHLWIEHSRQDIQAHSNHILSYLIPVNTKFNLLVLFFRATKDMRTDKFYCIDGSERIFIAREMACLASWDWTGSNTAEGERQ